MAGEIILEGTAMTTVLAVYEGGVLRPAHPLPLAEGETVEVTVAKPQSLFPDEWERRIRTANSIREWVALANACPDAQPDVDVVKAINDTRRQTGFRLPDPEPTPGDAV
jgi:predicted DNA-binding antitoxin AbrB/MazE fold protein